VTLHKQGVLHRSTHMHSIQALYSSTTSANTKCSAVYQYMHTCVVPEFLQTVIEVCSASPTAAQHLLKNLLNFMPNFTFTASAASAASAAAAAAAAAVVAIASSDAVSSLSTQPVCGGAAHNKMMR
jgi:hypothetical protein